MPAASSLAPHPLVSAEAAKAWYRGLPANDPKASIDLLSSAVAKLPRPIAASSALGVLEALETLRKPLHTLSVDLSARYVDKAVPLSETQRAAFDSNVTLAWTLAYVYYALITCAVGEGAPLAEYAALVHQRALFWTAHGMGEHLRGRQRFPDKDWDLAQEVLQSAGRYQLLETEVRDSLQPAGASSVSATYARLLLLHLTGTRSFAGREVEAALDLAHYLDNKTELSYIVADSHGVIAGMPRAEEEGNDPVKVVQTGSLLHFLEVGALSKSLGRRMDTLNQGRAFDVPKLQHPLSVTALKALLSKLHSAWCARANQRQFPRRRREEMVYCAFEAASIYALMKRRAYVAPPLPKVYDHHEVANIYLARDNVLTAQTRQVELAHSKDSWEDARGQLEKWLSQEESANGMSLMRTLGGARVRQGQLIALRLGDAGVAMIGVVRWAEQAVSTETAASGDARIDPGHTVEVGVQLLPGLARAGAVRFTGTAAVTTNNAKGSSAALILDHFSRSASRTQAGSLSGPNTIIPGVFPERAVAGDALPEIEAPEPAQEATGPYRYSERATIVLPTNFAREGETLEFIDGANTFKLKLGKQTHRHGDFDRLHFEVLES